MYEKTWIDYHKYGTNIFHNSSPKLWKYITQLNEFIGYHHQLLTTWQNKVYQMPINLEDINSSFKVNLKPYEVGTN